MAEMTTKHDPTKSKDWFDNCLIEKGKGVIDIEYNPIICMGCSKLLANTYVQKTDSYHITVGKFYIYCGECMSRK